jgi:GrpB-like predicted nucleotidyltransferase (UPF0157 family)
MVGGTYVVMDARLRWRLEAIGLDPDEFGDPSVAWRRLHERFGRRITLVDRYELERRELDAEERARLAREVLAVQYPEAEWSPGAARTDEIEVVPYDPVWPLTFEEWRARLAAALGETAARIEHVGSTAVPGLAAKPVIDIQVSVGDVEDEEAYVAAIESVGLLLRFREPGHRYFRAPAGQPRVVHVHVCDAGGEWEREHIAFRELLRADEELRDSYGRLKVELSERYADDRLAYTDAKTAFILDTLEAADQ